MIKCISIENIKVDYGINTIKPDKPSKTGFKFSSHMYDSKASDEGITQNSCSWG